MDGLSAWYDICLPLRLAVTESTRCSLILSWGARTGKFSIMIVLGRSKRVANFPRFLISFFLHQRRTTSAVSTPTITKPIAGF